MSTRTSETQEPSSLNNLTIDDLIRNYRRFHASARNIMLKLKGKNNGANRNIEMEIDPNEQLQVSNKQRANLVRAEVLYSDQHYSKERILITQVTDQLNLSIINETSFKKLKKEGMQYIHIGIVLIRIPALHRK